MNDFPRRIQMQRWCHAERLIQGAVDEVERMGADVRLTDAVVLLGAARDRVADFVDGVEGERTVPGVVPSAPSLPQNLCEFFWRCWDNARDGREIGGDDITEWGEELALLNKTPVTESCGDGCVCAEWDNIPGDCYRPAFERGGLSSAAAPP